MLKFNHKNIVLFCLILSGAIIFSGCAQTDEKKAITAPEVNTLYASEGCQHCQEVEEYIKANNIENIVEFKQKDISKAKENYDEFMVVARKCNLTGSVGVPLYWLGQEKNCLIGQDAIINYFESKASLFK